MEPWRRILGTDMQNERTFCTNSHTSQQMRGEQFANTFLLRFFKGTLTQDFSHKQLTAILLLKLGHTREMHLLSDKQEGGRTFKAMTGANKQVMRPHIRCQCAQHRATVHHSAAGMGLTAKFQEL